jgi:hypothetical protein
MSSTSTSITAVGSPPTLVVDVTTDAYLDPAIAGVTLDTCPVSSTCITSCTSVDTAVGSACVSIMDVLGTMLGNVMHPREAKHQEAQHQW